MIFSGKGVYYMNDKKPIEYIDEILPVEIGPAVQWALDQGYSKEQILIAAERDIPYYLEKVRQYLIDHAKR